MERNLQQTMARMEGSPTSYLGNLGDPTLWGLFKEAARLIRKYSMLLLPFVIIFALPVSLFSAFSLVSEATILLQANLIQAAPDKQVSGYWGHLPLGCCDHNTLCVRVSFHAEAAVIKTQCAVCIFPWGCCDQSYTHQYTKLWSQQPHGKRPLLVLLTTTTTS